MLSRIFKKQTFGIVNSLCKNNLLSFQSLSVKYFGAKKKNLSEITPEKIAIPKRPRPKVNQKQESSDSSELEEKVEKKIFKKTKTTPTKAVDVPKPVKKAIKKAEKAEKELDKVEVEDEDKDEVEVNNKEKKKPIKAKSQAKLVKQKKQPLMNAEEEQEETTEGVVIKKKKPIKAKLEVKPVKVKEVIEKEEEIEEVEAPTIKKKKLITKSIEKETSKESEAVKPKAPKSKKAKTTKAEDKEAKEEEEALEEIQKPQAKPKDADEIVSNKTKEAKTKKRTKKDEKATFDLPDLKSGEFKLGWKAPASELEMYDLSITGLYGIFENYINNIIPPKSKEAILKEQKYVCNNYAPLPIVLEKGNGVFLRDIENNVFIDFLAAYSAVNHGHNNLNVIKDLSEQAQSLYMTSRAFYNNKLGEAAELVCNIFKYEKVLFMNGGVEAVESAVKIVRRWGYQVKKIPDNQAKIVFMKGNFWGRSTYACATSDDPSRYEGFGPLQRDSHYMVEFNNIPELEKVLVEDSDICAVVLEPIQGENGVIIPDKGYLTKVQELCKTYNVLFVADEIQTGLGRAGHLLYCQEENIKPDIVCLGKSISAGLYPVSAVLSSTEIMDLIKPGEHGSTYGGNPLAAAIVLSSVRDMLSKQLVNNAYDQGLMLGNRLMELKDSKLVREIRGRGLMFGIEFHDDLEISAYHFSLWLMERGVLTKPTKKNILRLTPPISISTEELNAAADIIINVIKNAEKLLTKTNQERPSPTFDFPKVDPSYSKILNNVLKNQEAVESATLEANVTYSIKKNAFSLSPGESSNAEETLDQTVLPQQTVNQKEDFDPNPFLKINLENIEEELIGLTSNISDYSKKMTNLIYTYFENPLKYDSEEISINFNKELDSYKMFVTTLEKEDLKNFEKKINLTTNLELQNKNLYKKINNIIQDIKENTENALGNTKI